ncbi:Transcriptional repressor FrmR [Methylophilaceae bacterium]|nr:Transcriptional repressor FrmR [Methylophilaceae bacterium]
MAHIVHNRKNLLVRIHRIRGQADAMENALNKGVDCSAFLHQIASIRGAMDGLMSEVLEGHIREHLGEVSVQSEQRQQDLEQVISVLKTYLK